MALQTAPTLRPGEPTTGDLAQIVAGIPRFPPDRFVVFPPSVRDRYVAINCQVPQNSLSAGPANVISGEFAEKGQLDWAALCSDGTINEIRLVWGGPAQCEDRLVPRQDSDMIVRIGPGAHAYSRSIGTGSRSGRDVIVDNVDVDRLVHTCLGGRWQLME